MKSDKEFIVAHKMILLLTTQNWSSKKISRSFYTNCAYIIFAYLLRCDAICVKLENSYLSLFLIFTFTPPLKTSPSVKQSLDFPKQLYGHIFPRRMIQRRRPKSLATFWEKKFHQKKNPWTSKDVHSSLLPSLYAAIRFMRSIYCHDRHYILPISCKPAAV